MSLAQYKKAVGCVSPRASVTQACHQMKDKQIGAVVVISDDNKPLGLVTDRDVALRVVAESKDPNATMVEDIMSRGVVCLRDDASFQEATEQMRDCGVRRLPLVDERGCVDGIVSFDDILVLLGMELGNLASALFVGMSRRAAGAAAGQPTPTPTG